MRRRITLVAHGVHDRGGMERAASELLKHSAGIYRFVVVAHDLAPDLRPLVQWERVRVPSRPLPLKFVAFFLLAGLKVRRTDADLVHAIGAIVPNRVGLATVQFCQAGFIEATGRLGPEGAPPLRRVNNALFRLVALAAERWSYRPGRVRRLAAVSRGVAAELRRHYPGLAVSLTPNAVDASRFGADDEARASIRNGLAVGTETIVCLFVGGDWDRKGLGLAVDGVAAARANSGRDVALWVVGDGDARRFSDRAAARGIRDAVRFFGANSEAERFFRGADIFVLPTEYETFSLVGYEAAAASLPVVCTRVSGLDDLVGEDEAGIIVEREPAAVARALVRLASDAGLRHRMGQAGRRRASEFTWERSVRSVSDIYRELLMPSALPPRAPS